MFSLQVAEQMAQLCRDNGLTFVGGKFSAFRATEGEVDLDDPVQSAGVVKFLVAGNGNFLSWFFDDENNNLIGVCCSGGKVERFQAGPNIPAEQKKAVVEFFMEKLLDE